MSKEKNEKNIIVSDERKIHALILMAERERRRKEAKEAGRRFVEEENRRTNDEIFRQVEIKEQLVTF